MGEMLVTFFNIEKSKFCRSLFLDIDFVISNV